MAKDFQLPIYFHNRNTKGDFTSTVRKYRDFFSTGVVHSFTGDI